MAENRHPGISMHKLPVGPGFVGLLFTLGCVLIFLLGLPQLWYFLALSAALGVAVAMILKFVNRHRSERAKPLSILSASEKAKTPVVPDQNKRLNLLQALPQSFSA